MFIEQLLSKKYSSLFLCVSVFARNFSRQLLIKRLTEVVAEITGKPETYIYVRIDEVPHENFGIGGKSLS